MVHLPIIIDYLLLHKILTSADVRRDLETQTNKPLDFIYYNGTVAMMTSIFTYYFEKRDGEMVIW